MQGGNQTASPVLPWQQHQHACVFLHARPSFTIYTSRWSGRLTDQRLLTASEVAELLSVPKSWVREHTRNGRLPHIKLGHYRRYRREAILAWLETQEQASSPFRTHTPTLAA
jgi:excisionase family DNA binding protein